MDVVEAVWIAILGVGVLGAVSVVTLSAVRLRRAPHDRVVRFAYGWLATFAVLIGLCCCIGLVATLGDRVRSSPLAVAGIVVVNLLAQPVAGVFIVAGLCKLLLGLRGRVAVAWRRVPDEQLAELTPGARRRLAWCCAVQGMAALPLGLGLSYRCGWPLVQWALG